MVGKKKGNKYGMTRHSLGKILNECPSLLDDVCDGKAKIVLRQVSVENRSGIRSVLKRYTIVLEGEIETGGLRKIKSMVEWRSYRGLPPDKLAEMSPDALREIMEASCKSCGWYLKSPYPNAPSCVCDGCYKKDGTRY
jgi:hypothetical protein